MSLDGTKIHANASRHSALSYGHAQRIEAQSRAEVQELVELADQADNRSVPEGASLPEEIERREDRTEIHEKSKYSKREWLCRAGKP